MIVDLHSHTYYSKCGRDDPELLVKTMIENGVDVLGITDHNYGIGNRKKEYFNQLDFLKKKYSSEIKILRGIEVATHPQCHLGDEDISYFDYCLVENLDLPESVIKGDVVSYSKKLKTKVGIAHTDIFKFAQNREEGVEEYLKSLVNAGIFWELNVNYDSIHGYREHAYVKRFFESKEEQELVKKVGLVLSVGFDGHRVEDYDVKRVEFACDFLEKNNFKVFWKE